MNKDLELSLRNQVAIRGDALDHIKRVAKAARRPTNRLAWIIERAEHAFNGMPYDGHDFSTKKPDTDIARKLDQTKARNAVLRRALGDAIAMLEKAELRGVMPDGTYECIEDLKAMHTVQQTGPKTEEQREADRQKPRTPVDQRDEDDAAAHDGLMGG